MIAWGACRRAILAADEADVLHILSPSHLARGAQMLDGRPKAGVNAPGAIFVGSTVKKD
jgi:hypothetical protein